MATPKKITFVLGAGFSNTVGLPLGGELKDFIADVLEYYVLKKPSLSTPEFNMNHNSLIDYLSERDNNRRYKYGEYSLYSYRAIIELCDSLYNTHGIDCFKKIYLGLKYKGTIDRFLYDNKIDNNLCTIFRSIISACLLSAAANCSARYDDNYKNPLDMNSYQKLFQIIENDFEEDKLRSDNYQTNIRIINFNYDSSFNFFVYNEFTKMLNNGDYNSDYDRLDDIIRKNSVHIYGELLSNYQDFGNFQYSLELALSCKNRISYMKQTNNNSAISKARTFIHQSDILVFLGFGFDRQNLDLLFDDYQMESRSTDIISTAFLGRDIQNYYSLIDNTVFCASIRDYFVNKLPFRFPTSGKYEIDINKKIQLFNSEIDGLLSHLERMV